MTATLEFVSLTLGFLGVMTLAGSGLTLCLAPTALPGDTALALSPLVGVAAMSAIWAALILQTSTDRALIAGVAAPLLVTAAAFPKVFRYWRATHARSWVALTVIAFASVLAASVPYLAHGSDTPATWGNADPYLWVSQAKSLLSGPAPSPDTLFPDRVAYDHLAQGGWAPGLPALLALAARTTSRDPVQIFGPVAALLYALSPLVAFAIARLTLAWSLRLSVAAGLVVALNPFRLFSSFYGWQPQIAGVASALASALLFRRALSNRQHRHRSLILSSIVIAGALGIYRLPFLPYVTFILAAAALGFWRQQRWSRESFTRVVLVGALLSGLTLVVAAPSVIAFIGHAGTFWSRQGASAAWSRYARATPWDALGLVPRSSDLSAAASVYWRLAVAALALVILLSGVRAIRRSRTPESDLVVTLTIASIAAVGVVISPIFTPYYSIKVMAYATTPFLLVAMAPLRNRRTAPLALALAAACVCLSVTAVVNEGRRTLSASAFSGIAERVTALRPGEVIISYRSAWNQSWAIYFSRTRRTSVPHPSDYLTELGLERRNGAYVHPTGSSAAGGYLCLPECPISRPRPQTRSARTATVEVFGRHSD